MDFSKQHKGVDQALHTTSFASFKAVFLAGLSLSFFGIGLMRLWYQFNFYNLHFSADYGYVTVGANIVRVAVIALLVFLSCRTGFSHASKAFFVWSGLVLMTLSGLFYLVDLFFGTVMLEVPRFVIGGAGLVGGEVIWVFFLQRLRPAEVFFYAAGGLVLSCLLSLGAGYLSHEVFGLLNLFVPALSVFAYWHAMALVDRGENPSARLAGQTVKPDGRRVGRASSQSRSGEKADAPHDARLHRGYLLSVIAAFFLYALLIGMAMGYPDGRIRELSQTVRTIHQVLVVVVVAATVWWVLVRGRGLSLAGFWLFVNSLMIVGITFLMSGWPGSEEVATFFFTNAITCFYIPLVFFICLIGSQVAKPTVLVYGFVYGGALLAMSVGRIVVHQIGPHLDHGLWLLVCMVFVALVEMVIVVYPRPGVRYPLGYQLSATSRPASSRHAVVADTLPAEDDRLAVFAQAFQLTPVEKEIARLLAQGRSRTVIAETLNYSENTVRNYARLLYRKVGVHSKQELLDRIEDFESASDLAHVRR